MKKIYIIIAVAVVVFGALGIWAYVTWNAPVQTAEPYIPLTPEQTKKLLQDLETSSAKPAEPKKVQETVVKQLETSSQKPAESQKAQEDLLKQLEANSKH